MISMFEVQKRKYVFKCNAFSTISMFFTLNTKGIGNIRNSNGHTLLFSPFYGSGNKF